MSLRYNPLSRLVSYTDISEASHILINSANPRSPNQDSFWDSGAETILTVLIGTLVGQGRADQLNFAGVLNLLQQFGPDGTQLDGFIAEHALENIYNQYRGFLSGNPKVTQSFVSVAQNSLSMLNDPKIASLTAGDKLDFEELRRRKTAIFVIVPSEKIAFYGLLMNLFYSQLFNALMSRLPTSRDLPVFCLMDEFGHSAVPRFEMIAATIRKFHVSLSIILQSSSQLAAIYGKESANTILSGGIAARLIYSGVDMETAQQVERMMGRSVETQVFNDGTSSRKELNLMNGDRIRTMPDDEALLIFKNKEPIKLETMPYFRNRKFRR